MPVRYFTGISFRYSEIFEPYYIHKEWPRCTHIRIYACIRNYCEYGVQKCVVVCKKLKEPS